MKTGVVNQIDFTVDLVGPALLLLAEEQFIKRCRRKVQNINEQDLFVDGEYMSEEDMKKADMKETL